MPAVALANGKSLVECTDGVQGTLCQEPNYYNWDTSSVQASYVNTVTDVFFEDDFPVVEGDAMAPHPDGVPCVVAPVNHSPTLDTYSGTVYIGGKRVGRIGDTYNNGTSFNHVITTGGSTIFIG